MSNIRTYEISHSEQKPLPILQKDTTDYLLGGSLVMKNGTVDKFLFEGGYAQVKTAAKRFEFYYYNQDHLGNNREVVDAKGGIRQRTNYYAFGMTSDESSSSIQPYKYNGKEFDHMHGLNTYDYGARQYNPVTARWDRMDPLSEKYYSTSPYAYCANNPVRFIDPDGRALELKGNANDCGRFVSLLNQGAGKDVFAFEGSMVYIANPSAELNNEYSKFIASVINSENTVSLNVVSSSEEVIIGNYSTQTVDVADMENLNGAKYTSGALAAIHEVYEQNGIQVKNLNPLIAHGKAMGEESLCRKSGDYCENFAVYTEYEKGNSTCTSFEIVNKNVNDSESFTVKNNNIVK